MTFGERIQILRKQRKMSQEELGEKLEVTRQTISKWELGQSTPDLDYIVAISEFFEVTTDYLIKGNRSVADTPRSQSAAVPVPQLQYCADNDPSDNPVHSASDSGGVSVSASSDCLVIKLNLKALLRILIGLLLIFFGIMGVAIAFNLMVQPLYSYSIWTLILLFLSGGVLITGLSAFAGLLLRYYNTVKRLCTKASRFIDNLVTALRITLSKEDLTVRFTVKEGVEVLAEASTENTAEVPSDLTGAAELIGGSLFRRSVGGLLIIASCLGGFACLYTISHFFDGSNRNFVVLLGELLAFLISVIAFSVGIKLFFGKPKNGKHCVNGTEESEEAVIAQRQAVVFQGSEQRTREKVLQEAESIGRSLFRRGIGGLLIIASFLGGFACFDTISHFFYPINRNPVVLLGEMLAFLIAVIAFFVGIKLFFGKPKNVKRCVNGTEESEEAVIAQRQAAVFEASEQRAREKALKEKEAAEIKAAAVREKYILKAEAIAPYDEAKAEKLTAKGEAKAVRIMEKKGRKFLRQMLTYNISFHPFGNGKEGAHLRKNKEERNEKIDN